MTEAERAALGRHIFKQLSKLWGRGKSMFHVELTTDEKPILETALNHHIGALLAHVGLLAQAHGAGAPCVEKARQQALIADRLSDKLKDASFKLVEVAR
jgi:hypothetical protein